MLFTLFDHGYNRGPAGLYILSADGQGPPLELLYEADQDSVNLPGSSWNGVGARIVFASDRQAEGEEVWTVSESGNDLQRVTRSPNGTLALEPSFSPDGTRIVFETETAASDDQRQGSLAVVRADGTQRTLLTDGPGGGTDDRQPNWSPAGERIAFQRRPVGTDAWDLYTMAADGGDLQRVLDAASEDTDVSWSPDGKWLVFSSDFGGLTTPSLFVIPAAGGSPIEVTDTAGVVDSAPSWSADGTIAFESHPDDDLSPACLYRIPAPVDGTAGTAYYVAPDGDDGGPGNEERPWRTIGHAAEALAAGDTLFVRAGTYHERVVPRRSGRANRWITYSAYPGETATIDGGGVSLPQGWGGLVEIVDRSYLRVSGLRIVHAGPDDNHVGILVEGSDHVVVENNTTYDTAGSGIGVWNSADVVIAGNEVELACNDGEQECITVAGTSGFEIYGNHVHHGGPGTRGGEGIDAKDGSAHGRIWGNRVDHLRRLGIYVDAWDKHTHDIEVFGNVVTACTDGVVVASEAGGLLEKVRIFNNVAYENRFVGLIVAGWGESVPRRPMRDVAIVNNTFADNGDAVWGGGIMVENPDAESLLIRNNVVSRNTLFQIALDAGVPTPAADHNLIDGFRGYEGEIRGVESRSGDPLFEDRQSGDFRLRSGSPAVDAGVATGAPSQDFDGVVRPQGAGFDLGAFELANGGGGGDATCAEDETTLCLHDGRFRLEVSWRDFRGGTGSARRVNHGTDDSGLFWFFSSNNWEMLVKVLDGCAVNDHYWVFAAATTNVEYTLRVTDTEHSKTRSYFNRLGRSSPAITDAEAFATCP